MILRVVIIGMIILRLPSNLPNALKEIQILIHKVSFLDSCYFFLLPRMHCVLSNLLEVNLMLHVLQFVEMCVVLLKMNFEGLP